MVPLLRILPMLVTNLLSCPAGSAQVPTLVLKVSTPVSKVSTLMSKVSKMLMLMLKMLRKRCTHHVHPYL